MKYSTSKEWANSKEIAALPQSISDT